MPLVTPARAFELIAPLLVLGAAATLFFEERPRPGWSPECTQPSPPDLLIEVSGATARCRAHMVAYHHVPTPGVDYLTMRGYWQLDLVSTNEKWVIRRWTIVRTAPWEGNPDLYRIAREGA
ncbi:nuclear transport factor 2 family protein [Streptomyces sp. NEAU-174]|uniref:nuclear transport factor 2 family protein n=1 Tax=Streptomyces sp. NEAU-174 TaxID=3458254 RepID=UPI0040448B02